MTRIIAGAFGGQRLRTPAGSGTRPTSDRVREALFSALESMDAIQGEDVLDLYAGSGALGFEAISRGAASAVFVDTARPALDAVRRSIAQLSGKKRGGPRMSAVGHTAMGYLQQSSGGFGLVFVDPPYDLGEEPLAQVLAALAPLLLPHAVVVVERSTRSPAPTLPEGLESFREKSYGETALHFLEPAAASSP